MNSKNYHLFFTLPFLIILGTNFIPEGNILLKEIIIIVCGVFSFVSLYFAYKKEFVNKQFIFVFIAAALIGFALTMFLISQSAV